MLSAASGVVRLVPVGLSCGWGCLAREVGPRRWVCRPAAGVAGPRGRALPLRAVGWPVCLDCAAGPCGLGMPRPGSFSRASGPWPSAFPVLDRSAARFVGCARPGVRWRFGSCGPARRRAVRFALGAGYGVLARVVRAAGACGSVSALPGPAADPDLRAAGHAPPSSGSEVLGASWPGLGVHGRGVQGQGRSGQRVRGASGPGLVGQGARGCPCPASANQCQKSDS